MNQTPEVPEEDEEVNPSASALIEALRSFGYSVSTSIADLIDNSISAGASVIDVDLRWTGPDTIATIRDDGRGMSEEELRDAMKAGSRSPLEERSPEDLGRFGLGLKTASFSQARSLTVASKQKKKFKFCSTNSQLMLCLPFILKNGQLKELINLFMSFSKMNFHNLITQDCKNR